VVETPIQKQDLAQTEDNIQTLRWVALGLWSVCIDQDEVAWAFDTHVNRPLRYRYILAPESVLHIPVDYYLSVHNSGKIYLQHHHWYYIHTYTRYTFFLNSSLFMMALSLVFVIHIKAIRPCWYLGFYKLTTVLSLIRFIWHWHNKLSYC
jgi:hypothetical protein